MVDKLPFWWAYLFIFVALTTPLMAETISPDFAQDITLSSNQPRAQHSFEFAAGEHIRANISSLGHTILLRVSVVDPSGITIVNQQASGETTIDFTVQQRGTHWIHIVGDVGSASVPIAFDLYLLP